MTALTAVTSKTWLQLSNQIAQEAGITGAAAAITTCQGQTGQALRIVNWVKRAHQQIQDRHEHWRWLRSTFTVDTVIGTDTYAPTACTDSRLGAAIVRFARWITFDEVGALNIKVYLNSGGVGGQHWMVFLPWAYFQSIYRLGTQNNGPIAHVTIDPQNNLVVGPRPDAVYTISGEYQMCGFEFTADADTPEFPARFHELVAYRAMEKSGLFSAAGEVLASAQLEHKRMMRALEADQLPDIGLAGPLA